VPRADDTLDDPLPPLGPGLLDDDDDLVDAIARRVARIEPGIAEMAVLESALDVVRDQLVDGHDALALALAVLDERRDELLLRLVRAAIVETVAAIRDADGMLQDEEQRGWWIDRVLREDEEVRRLGERLRRREDALRAAVGDDHVWRLYLRVDEAGGARAAESQDALLRARLRGHPAPQREAGR
jgi:hypothetical protein